MFHQAHLTRLSPSNRATLSGSVQVLTYGCEPACSSKTDGLNRCTRVKSVLIGKYRLITLSRHTLPGKPERVEPFPPKTASRKGYQQKGEQESAHATSTSWLYRDDSGHLPATCLLHAPLREGKQFLPRMNAGGLLAQITMSGRRRKSRY